MTSVSEPFDGNSGVASLIDELLQDFPYHKLSPSVDSQERRRPRRRVTISEPDRSGVRVYRPDPAYARTKSYKTRDYDSFHAKTLSEALHINRMIFGTGLPAMASIHLLLKRGSLTWEDMLGVEHLIMVGRGPLGAPKGQGRHARAVLAERRRLLRDGAGDGVSDTLARFSKSRTAMSAKLARIRAAMATKSSPT